MILRPGPVKGIERLAGLVNADDGGVGRQIDVEADRGDILLEGVEGRPILVLDRVGEGRVAQLLTDHMWLWARGFEGGGPQAELLRRLAHWLMKEPDLEEENLSAVVHGNRLEITRRSLADDGDPVATGHLMQMALLYAGQLGLPVMDHCEDHSITRRLGMNEGTHGLGMNEGWVASRLGLAGYPSAAEESIVARDIALLELAGGALHIAHLSTAGGIEQVRRAKERGLRVTAEATPHHLTMTDAWVLGSHGRGSPDEALSNDAYETRAKVSPPLRAETDRQALVEALADGTVDAIATDHAPHTFADKAVPFEEATVGLSVLETALGSLMGLVHGGALDLAALVHRLTAGPAGVLGERYAEFATLRKGTPADVVLFDPNESWVVDAASFASKGKNTPLDGETLVGRVKLTIAGGEIAYDGLAS